MKIKYERTKFTLPVEGVTRGELVEIKDLGAVMSPDGQERQKVRLIWQLRDQPGEDGGPLQVFQTFNATLHPQSFLSRAILDITGEAPGEEFELDDLVGVEVDLVLKHSEPTADGRVYCNVAAILRKKTAAEEGEEQRITTATEKIVAAGQKTRGGGGGTQPVEITDDDIPF